MKPKQSGEIENETNNLNSLTHPLVLLSITILLLNDHVLKVYSPSWLTGKLSDFMGVFFFPIFLSTILNIIWKPINLKQRHITITAFGFTTIWFGLIKTLPFFGHLTENIISGFLSIPSQIICDPSDLLALIMLFPSWKLQTINERLPNTKNTKLSYFSLCVAAIATLATSPGYSNQVTQLTVYENKIFANFDHHSHKIYYSWNGGSTWAEVDFDLPEQVINDFEKSQELPVTVCLPSTPSVCYQTGPEKILQSLDGGETWNTNWDIPLVQRRFMRYSYPYMELGPNDLIFLEMDNKQFLVAAMGSEGVLVKTDDGPWESVEINGLGPIKYKDANLIDAIGIVGPEIFTISMVSIFLLLTNIIVNAKRTDRKEYIWLISSVMALVISVGLVIFLFYIQLFFTLTMVLIRLSGFVAVVSIAFIIASSFVQLKNNLSKQGMNGMIALAFLWFISCGLYILWVYDVIHETRPTYIAVIILNASYLVWLLWRIAARIEQYRTKI